LNELCSKLNKVGVLILDDYARWGAFRRAIDENFLDKTVLALPIARSGRRVIVKQNLSELGQIFSYRCSRIP
jgi:hypothetical protein